jgi:hypothetical protein
MLYLLDANVLIDSANGYFQLDRVPQFWAWLMEKARSGQLALPREIWEEFKDGDDALARWVRSPQVVELLVLRESPHPQAVQEVVNVYAPDLNDQELEKLGRDPFLIAYAYLDPRRRAVVTAEVSRPRKQRANKKIPDVCSALGITCLDIVGLINTLDFRIS